MFLQDKIEQAAMAVVSMSLSSSNVTGWQIVNGMNNTFVEPPMVKIVCDKFEPMYKELSIGYGRTNLYVTTFGVKADMLPSVFETVSDIVLDPFLSGSIVATMNSNIVSASILAVHDNGLNVTTLEDGWAAEQSLEIIAARTI